jgi:hypothetical protein
MWGDKPTLWIKLDLHEPLEYYISAEKVITVLSTVLKSAMDPNITRYLIELYRYRVAIVPVVRGKLINRLGWNLLTESAMNGVSPDAAWSYVPQEIPAVALQTFGLTEWDNPDIILATTLSVSVASMAILGSQLADIVRTPSIEDVVMQSVQKSIDHRTTMFSQCLQSACDTITAMLEKINMHNASPQIQHRLLFAKYTQALHDLHELILPFSGFNGTHSIKMNDFPEYSQRLQDAFTKADYMRLLWIKDTLDNL